MPSDQNTNKGSALVPVGGLMLACALMLAVIIAHLPEWFIIVIFLGWWAVFLFWGKKHLL